MIKSEQVLVEGAHQLIITSELQYSPNGLEIYQEKFYTLKENGTILQNNFSDFAWLTKYNYRELGKTVNITFKLSDYPEVNMAIKCLALSLLDKGFTGGRVATLINLLQKVVQVSRCFARYMIEDFEEYIYEQADYTKFRIAQITGTFCSFYNFDYDIDDYIEVIETIPRPEDKVRSIPNYKSILKFDEKIKSIILEKSDKDKSGKDNKLKYFPLFLWWIITGVIPMRASEFLELRYDCNFIEKGRYWIRLPRSKVKKSSTNIIQKVDVQEINQFTYSFIEQYKSMLKSEFQSKFLLSWKAYSSFHHSFAARTKKNPEIMGLEQIRLLFNEFYREYIKDEEVVPLKPGDSRHIAFCNLMLQGHNPIAIARYGGHTRLSSQTHYYEHLDTYAESYVFAMAEKILLDQRFEKNPSNSDINRRARAFSTYSPAEIRNFLEIEKGHCTIKTPGCKDFSSCEESCWDCHYHIIDIENRTDAQIELQQRSDKLEEVIKEQIGLLQSISKSMFIDLATEQCSFNGDTRLLSTSEQLGTAMAKKIVIDSKLLKFVTED